MYLAGVINCSFKNTRNWSLMCPLLLHLVCTVCYSYNLYVFKSAMVQYFFKFQKKQWIMRSGGDSPSSPIPRHLFLDFQYVLKVVIIVASTSNASRWKYFHSILGDFGGGARDCLDDLIRGPFSTDELPQCVQGDSVLKEGRGRVSSASGSLRNNQLLLKVNRNNHFPICLKTIRSNKQNIGFKKLVVRVLY